VQRGLSSVVRAYRDVAPAPGRFPVIVYSPGSNSPAIQNELLGEFLASQGYIFVASPSWGGLGDLESTARDLEYLVAYARTLPNADPARVALMGHSLGGVAVVQVASRNPSISAVVSLDGTMVYQNRYLADAVAPRALREYSVPSLFLTQGPFTAELRQAFNADSTFAFFDGLRYADAWRVYFHRLRHRNFNSLTNRLAAPGDPFEFNPDAVVVSRDYDAMATYALHFLNAYLKGDATSLAFLSRPPADHGYRANVVSMERKAGWPDRYALVRRLRDADAGQIEAERARIKGRVGDYSDLDARSLNEWSKMLIGSRPADAVASARVMTTLYPTFAGGFVTAGVAELAAAGDSVMAARHFRRALELDSSLVWLKGWISQYGQRGQR
jgi:pimeloyl-ACP methyl ester carboxylesterase